MQTFKHSLFVIRNTLKGKNVNENQEHRVVKALQSHIFCIWNDVVFAQKWKHNPNAMIIYELIWLSIPPPSKWGPFKYTTFFALTVVAHILQSDFPGHGFSSVNQFKQYSWTNACVRTNIGYKKTRVKCWVCNLDALASNRQKNLNEIIIRIV